MNNRKKKKIDLGSYKCFPNFKMYYYTEKTEPLKITNFSNSFYK